MIIKHTVFYLVFFYVKYLTVNLLYFYGLKSGDGRKTN